MAFSSASRDGWRSAVSSFALTGGGDGLRPKFAEGDIVVVDPDRIPKPGDFVVLYDDAKIAEFGDHDGHPGLFHAIIGKAAPR